MKKTYCDHCGKEAKDFSVQVEIRMGEAHVEYHDLCEECLDGFITLTQHFFETRRIKK